MALLEGQTGFGFPHQFPFRDRNGDNCLLQRPVEQPAARTGCLAVEPKREFIWVVIQMVLADSDLMRPEQPALQQGGYAMHPREVLLDATRIAARHRSAMPVTEDLQNPTSRQCGQDCRTVPPQE